MYLLPKIVSVLLFVWVSHCQDVTFEPSSEPSYSPSNIPTNEPTSIPTTSPTSSPSFFPSSEPSYSPSNFPTNEPTSIPTISPTSSPSFFPSAIPTIVPTAPSFSPTVVPTKTPTKTPSATPTKPPTTTPTVTPTSSPSLSPTVDYVATCSALFPNYCHFPTPSPTSPPTNVPTPSPSSIPTAIPTAIPTSKPSATPTSIPTAYPSAIPSAKPSFSPTPLPTSQTDFIKNTCLTTPFCTGNYSTHGYSDLTTPANVFLKILCLEQSYCILPTPNPTSAPTVLPSSIPTFLPTPFPAAPTPVPTTATPTSIPTVSPTIYRQWYGNHVGNVVSNVNPLKVATSYYGNMIYLVSSSGTIYSSNYGSSFNNALLIPGNGAAISLATNADGSIVFGIQNGYLYQGPATSKYVSNLYDSNLQSVSCDLNCYRVVATAPTSTHTTIYYSTNYGTSFSQVYVGYPWLGNVISGRNNAATQFLAYSSQYIVVSAYNDPTTWTLRYTFSGNNLNYCVAEASLSNIYCILNSFSPIYYSHDGGYTFQTTGSSSVWKSITSDVSGQYVYAVDQNGYVFMSTDYGITFNYLIYFDSTTTFVSASGNNAKVYQGNNDGYIYYYSA